MPFPETAESYVLGGQVRLRQPLKGHRAGTDAVLLAACLPASQTGRVLDLGAGVGTIGLAAARRAPQMTAMLVEREPELARLAAENIILNGLSQRVTACEADILSAKSRAAAGLTDRMADCVMTNPPFYKARSVQHSPEPLKARAYAMEASLSDWMRACAALLVPQGKIYMVHLASALPDCLLAMQGRFGDVRIIPVYSKPGEAASRLLLRGTKGSRAAPSLLPGLVMHDGQNYSKHGDAILKGTAAISFDQ